MASAPAAPDYRQLAEDQAGYDARAAMQQTIANRPNQETPFGTISYTVDPDTGQWTQREQYDPRVQGLADKSLEFQGQLQGQMGGLMNRPSFQTAPGASLYNPTAMNVGQFNPQALGVGGYNPQNLGMAQYQNQNLGVGQYQNQNLGMGQYSPTGQIGQFNQQMNDEYADQFTESLLARVRPQQQVDQRAMETRLRLQGLQPGTEAYDRAYQNLLTSQGDVTAQAQLQGQLAGGQEARSMYDTMLQGQMARGSEGRANYETQLQSALQRAGFKQGEYDTQLQSALARAGFKQGEYGTQLESALKRGQFGMDQYNTQLASALQRSENNRSDYRTQFEAEQRRQDVNRQNYATRMMGQEQMNNQSLQEYMQPYEDIGTMQGLAGSFNQYRPGYQSFMGATGSAGPDMMGAAQQQYAQQMQNYNDRQAQRAQNYAMWGSVIGGVAGSFVPGVGTAAGAGIGGALGGYAAGVSDARIKENIEVIDDETAYKAMQHIHPYSFSWPSGKRASGVMAQEIKEHFPHLVSEVEPGTGLLRVDYEGFTALLLGAFRHMAKQGAQQ